MAISLSSRDRQALETIEDQLAASDQQLASMLALFTRLTAGEAMPAQGSGERACGGRKRCARVRRTGRHRRAARSRPGGLGGKLLMVGWLAISVVLIAVAAVISRGDASPCMAPGAAACAAHPAPDVHPHLSAAHQVPHRHQA